MKKVILSTSEEALLRDVQRVMREQNCASFRQCITAAIQRGIRHGQTHGDACAPGDSYTLTDTFLEGK